MRKFSPSPHTSLLGLLGLFGLFGLRGTRASAPCSIAKMFIKCLKMILPMLVIIRVAASQLASAEDTDPWHRSVSLQIAPRREEQLRQPVDGSGDGLRYDPSRMLLLMRKTSAGNSNGDGNGNSLAAREIALENFSAMMPYAVAPAQRPAHDQFDDSLLNLLRTDEHKVEPKSKIQNSQTQFPFGGSQWWRLGGLTPEPGHDNSHNNYRTTNTIDTPAGENNVDGYANGVGDDFGVNFLSFPIVDVDDGVRNGNGMGNGNKQQYIQVNDHEWRDQTSQQIGEGHRRVQSPRRPTGGVALNKRGPIPIESRAQLRYRYGAPHYPYSRRMRIGSDEAPLDVAVTSLRANRRNYKRKQRYLGAQPHFIPSISAGAMTHLGKFFKDLTKNLHFSEHADVGPSEKKLLEGDHPLRLLSEDIAGGNPENEVNKTSKFLHAIRTYRPSQKIRSLVAMNPQGYHGSQFIDPNYMWLGLGK